MTGPQVNRNCASAEAMAIKLRTSTPAPNSPRRLAKTGVAMPKPVIIKAQLPVSDVMIERTLLSVGLWLVRPASALASCNVIAKAINLFITFSPFSAPACLSSFLLLV